MKQRFFQENTVDVGDALEIMAGMPEGSVDISITSPPYNIGKQSYRDRYSGGKYRDEEVVLEAKKYQDFIFASIDLMLKVTKYYVFFNIQPLAKNWGIVYDLFDKYRDRFKELFVWAKINPPCSIVKGKAADGFEFIFCFSNLDDVNKRAFDRCNFERKDYVKNVFIEPVNSQNPYSAIHSATFPPWLPGRLIKWFSLDNDLIFDPFVGCGETMIQAINQNRRYYGCDISPEYVAITNQRIKDVTSQLNLFESKVRIGT